MSRIGIGISSYKRPEHLDLCLRQIFKHTPAIHPCVDFTEYTWQNEESYYKFYVAKDIPNIAKAKNECLYNLRDCDHIFLFDDDCFPVKDGWVEDYVNSEHHHLLHLSDRNIKFKEFKDYSCYRECGGCFMYIRKDVFEKVGYFNSEYRQYGFEHAGYTNRVFNAGLTYEKYMSLNDYILCSLDYQGEGDWGVKHKPSITDYKAMQESIDYNRKVFEREINGDKIYYEYEK